MKIDNQETIEENLTTLEFKTRKGKPLKLFSSKDVFTPNTTTELLINAVKKTINSPARILDLGCGTGVVGLSLFLEGIVEGRICASDLSSSAVTCSQLNFKKYACKADVRFGSLFNPWEGMKFDVIIDDISGISQDVALISPWFGGVPCETGTDGTDLLFNILLNSSKYLMKDGSLFFPVLSLSNVDNILKVAKEKFASIELIGRTEWPLPKELEQHMPLLKKLSNEGSIKIEERFGMILCFTEVYQAKKPY